MRLSGIAKQEASQMHAASYLFNRRCKQFFHNRMRPFSQRTSQDTRCIVFSGLLFVLAPLNFSLAGALQSVNGSITEDVILNFFYIPLVQYAASSLLLVNTAIALYAGIAGLDKISEALIGLTVTGIIFTLTAGGYTIKHGLVQQYDDICNTIHCRDHVGTSLYGFSVGLVTVNCFSLLVLAILSIDGCVSVNRRRTNYPPHQNHMVATVIQTIEPYPYGSYPPGLPYYYVSEAPPQGFYPSQLPPGYAVETFPQCYPPKLPGVYVSGVAQNNTLDANSYEYSTRTTV